MGRYNAGLMALINQDFATGWDGYELRFEVPPWQGSLAPLALPSATPANILDVRRIAVRKEQGVGDQVLFSTLLPELAARGIATVAEVDSRLLSAYRRSLPGIEFVTSDQAAAAFSSCTHQAPIGSLARIFRRSRESFAAQPRALLRADPQRVRQLSERMPGRPRIGITWRSFRGKLVGESKSFALERFGILAGGAATLVDLQYGDVEAERRRFDERHPGLRHAIEGLDLFNDLEGLAAAIDLCDLVVTGSNVTAHLAGAIGKRTWLVYLEGVPPFHYWSAGADGRSLWYPSVEIMTDRAWTGWDQALGGVAARWRAEYGP
jgi:hypothetical protein